MNNLGRLEKVSLREVWENEASHFTPWLSDDQNLRLLGESLGLELELIQREKNVGPFSADILCKNVSDDTWILIENQLEKTDHTHLGQLLTYAAGLDAVTIIWIAETFTEQHRAAIDWLNEITGEQFSFFAIEIELWKIGDSPVAPKFNIVSKPNDWVKNVQTSAKSNQELSDHQQFQQLFWTRFKEYMSKNSRVTCQKPSPQHWMTHPIGKSGVHMSL